MAPTPFLGSEKPQSVRIWLEPCICRPHPLLMDETLHLRRMKPYERYLYKLVRSGLCYKMGLSLPYKLTLEPKRGDLRVDVNLCGSLPLNSSPYLDVGPTQVITTVARELTPVLLILPLVLSYLRGPSIQGFNGNYPLSQLKTSQHLRNRAPSEVWYPNSSPRSVWSEVGTPSHSWLRVHQQKHLEKKRSKV